MTQVAVSLVRRQWGTEDNQWWYGGGVLRARGAVHRSAPGGEAATVSYMPGFDASLPSAVLGDFSRVPSAGLMPPAVPAPSSPAPVPPAQETSSRGLTAQALATASRPLAGGHRTTRLYVAVPYRSCISSPGRLMLLLRSAGPAGYVATAPSDASRENPSGEFSRAPDRGPPCQTGDNTCQILPTAQKGRRRIRSNAGWVGFA